MNSDIANTPGGVDIGSIFGEEDTVPLSMIAEDMTLLVTSSRNGKNAVGNSNFIESSGSYGGGASAVNSGHALNNGSQSNVSRNNHDGRQFADSDNFGCLQVNTGLAGLPISQMNSFDTMASRVSAPNLVSLHEMSLRKAGNSSHLLPITKLHALFADLPFVLCSCDVYARLTSLTSNSNLFPSRPV